MSATITVTPEPHWLNGWFLRLFARPYVLVDQVEQAARWGRDLHIEANPGRHTVAMGARYYKTKPLLGAVVTEVDVEPNQHVRLTAQNGPLNHQPFKVRAAQ